MDLFTKTQNCQDINLEVTSELAISIKGCMSIVPISINFITCIKLYIYFLLTPSNPLVYFNYGSETLKYEHFLK
jgi:hypothetical protein